MKFTTIGSDPEFFVLDPKGKPYPATLFTKGSKENPLAILSLGTGYFEQRDNLSFEGNIPYVSSIGNFIEVISVLRTYFERKVGKFGYSLSPNGVEYFENRYLKTPEGMEFGCSSVVSSWDSHSKSLASRPTPVLSKTKYRVAGFHIHIGIDPKSHTFTPEQAAVLVGRLFDLFLTMPSHEIKPEPERLASYGKYGMIRVKSYGVECRTLSSYFTQKDKLEWVWNQLFRMENFINSCSKEDLMILIENRHFPGSTNKQLSIIFRGLFEQFTNKNVLLKFKETKEIYENAEYNFPQKAKFKPIYETGTASYTVNYTATRRTF